MQNLCWCTHTDKYRNNIAKTQQQFLDGLGWGGARGGGRGYSHPSQHADIGPASDQ